jgi:hypothetical protein
VRKSRAGTLLENFERLLDSHSPQERGYLFESLLSQLLHSNGFRVHRNAKTAKPRQTDLIAEYSGKYFLIETKWTKKPLGSNDVDDLRKRIDRVPPDVIGCLFSMSDFAKPAIDEVLRDRTREILLFDSREIYSMFSSRISFWSLVEKKRTQLRTHASIWFYPIQTKTGALEVSETLPEPSIFVGRAGNNAPWVTKSSDRTEVVFSHDMAYVDNSMGGNCIGFRVNLDIGSINDLQHALALSVRHFGLSGNGSYSIHQLPYAWHGFGLKSFLQAVGSWRDRYAAVGLESFHHSEELAFFHQLQPGMLCVNARQRVSENSFVHGAEMQIFLPGIPVDMQPFHAFCRDLDLWSGHFESLGETSTETITFYDRIPLKVSSLVISVDDVEESISGAVVKNPFYKKMVKFKDDQSQSTSYVSQQELIFCAFRDWLPASFKPGTLVLKSLEATRIGQSPILRPVCTWETSSPKQAGTYVKEKTRKKFEETTAKILKSIEIAERFTGKKG